MRIKDGAINPRKGWAVLSDREGELILDLNWKKKGLQADGCNGMVREREEAVSGKKGKA